MSHFDWIYFYKKHLDGVVETRSQKYLIRLFSILRFLPIQYKSAMCHLLVHLFVIWQGGFFCGVGAHCVERQACFAVDKLRQYNNRLALGVFRYIHTNALYVLPEYEALYTNDTDIKLHQSRRQFLSPLFRVE